MDDNYPTAKSVEMASAEVPEQIHRFALYHLRWRSYHRLLLAVLPHVKLYFIRKTPILSWTRSNQVGLLCHPHFDVTRRKCTHMMYMLRWTLVCGLELQQMTAHDDNEDYARLIPLKNWGFGRTIPSETIYDTDDPDDRAILGIYRRCMSTHPEDRRFFWQIIHQPDVVRLEDHRYVNDCQPGRYFPPGLLTRFLSVQDGHDPDHEPPFSIRQWVAAMDYKHLSCDVRPLTCIYPYHCRTFQTLLEYGLEPDLRYPTKDEPHGYTEDPERPVHHTGRWPYR